MASVEKTYRRGVDLFLRGELDKAALACEEIRRVKPGHLESLHLLGAIREQQGHHEQALQFLSAFLERRPDSADARFDLGRTLKNLGRLAEAGESFRQVIRLDPRFELACFELGDVLRSEGRPLEALEQYRRAIEIAPRYLEAHINLAMACKELGQFGEAERRLREAIAIEPRSAEAHNNLATVLLETNRYDEAEASCRHALAINPDLVEAHWNLATTLKDSGRPGEALAHCRRALEVDPQSSRAFSILLMTMNYMPGIRSAEMLDAHLEFNRRFRLENALGSHRNTPEPHRKLRIGYVSSDLRNHSMERFVSPALLDYDRDAFSVHCYYNFPRADATTERFRQSVDGWRDIYGLPDERVLQDIEADAIDILVDLNGYTAYNRMALVARKPAPVQVSYLGYAATTGLAAVDYRLTDALADPPGEADRWYTEKLVRLPDSVWCYAPGPSLPGTVSPAPVSQNGFVTLGSLNSFAKINDEVLSLWARVFAALPGAKFVFAAVPEGQAQRMLRERLANRGFALDRVEIFGNLPNFHDLYARIDIALDPFPCGGGATTCECLWMGLPVITLVGESFLSRAGYSLATAAGYPEFAAAGKDEYVELASRLGRDPQRLAALRQGMRTRLAASALMDRRRYARNLEAAYRSMWEEWCRRVTGDR